MPLFNPNIEVDALTKMNAELLLNKYKFVPHLSRMVAVEWTELMASPAEWKIRFD